MPNIMLDLETLGTSPGCVILSVGAVEFSPNGLGEEFHAVINRRTAMAAGLVEDPETVMWWNGQDEGARETVLRSLTTHSDPIGYALNEFSYWCHGLGDIDKLNVWGNGADFDNPILAHAFKVCGFSPLWNFRNNRCYRTLRTLAPYTKAGKREGVFHNAVDDARYQAQHAVAILTHLGTWGHVG